MEVEHINQQMKNDDGIQEEDERPRYIIRDAKYAIEFKANLEYVVEQLITSGSVSLWFGESGSKKTYSLLSMIVCVAMGKPWVGFEVKPRKILIIDEESGEQRLSLRLKRAIRGELGAEDLPIKYVSMAAFALDNKKDAQEIEKLITETEAGVVLMDSLSALMVGDENSKEEVQPVFSALRRIAERTNAAIIVIHHPNKTGGYRGSSAIKGALDFMVKVESENDSNFVSFKTEKVRDGEPVSFTVQAAWVGDDEDGQFYLSRVDSAHTVKPNAADEYVLKYLAENGNSALPDIKSAADVCSAKSAELAVYRLARAGRIYRTNKDQQGRGTVAYYDLSKYENDGPL